MYSEFINFVRSLYKTSDIIALHEPCFKGNEKKYLNECIDSTFVSSVGKFVDLFEQRIAKYTDTKYAIAVVNGTAALHIALILSDIRSNDEVITQPLTFIATANAISYTGAKPVFIDVDKATLGLSPDKLCNFLTKKTNRGKDGFCYNTKTGKRIKACVPMHTYGHPVKIDEIKTICDKNNIVLIEDAAESIGSYYKEQHTGTFGLMGILSFNGNKTITAGGGGMIITDDKSLARKAKHLTTTAKVPHKWNYEHDCIGYNYRLTNLAAALGVAQIEQLPQFLQAKRELAKKYEAFFSNSEMQFIKEPEDATSNYWLNTIILKNKKERDSFLSFTNERSIMTRPAWKLMSRLNMFKDSQHGDLSNAEWLTDRLINIPSSIQV